MIEKLNLSPGKAGIIGGTLSLLFLITFVILGFVQPGYNHLRTTISTLVVGEYGWIQTVNFVLLALSFAFIGFGLGKSITGRRINSIFGLFLALVICVIAVALIPTDKLDPSIPFSFSILSTTGKIHYLIVFVLLLITPLLFFQILNWFRKSGEWQILSTYTTVIFVFNFIVGLLWFYFLKIGFLLEWKGLMQKILATNVLIWLAVVGFRLRKLEKKAQERKTYLD